MKYSDNAQTHAERQLAWSRRYLRQEKRRRFLRRAVPTAALALLLGAGAYAAVNGGLALPAVGAQTPASVSASVPASVPASAPQAASLPQAQPSACLVTFDSRGGTEMAGPLTVAPGTQLAAPEEPTREGYLFAGWYTDLEIGRAHV